MTCLGMDSVNSYAIEIANNKDDNTCVVHVKLTRRLIGIFIAFIIAALKPSSFGISGEEKRL